MSVRILPEPEMKRIGAYDFKPHEYQQNASLYLRKLVVDGEDDKKVVKEKQVSIVLMGLLVRKYPRIPASWKVQLRIACGRGKFYHHGRMYEYLRGHTHTILPGETYCFEHVLEETVVRIRYYQPAQAKLPP